LPTPINIVFTRSRQLLLNDSMIAV